MLAYEMRRHRNTPSWAETVVRGTLVLVVLATVGSACGGGTYSRDNDAGGTGGETSSSGGSSPIGTGGTGGSATATGGAGASPISTGGASAGVGGAASGGMAGSGTGGRGGIGGGAATGGAAGGRGGATATGGRGTGGASTGGSSGGGRGGANTGGAATGGANTGGAATGGAATGGAATGGANTGGANTGGANTGGMGTGGAATGGMGTGGAAAPSGAILYYPFDETTGTAVADQSGNARNGTVTGGTFAAGVVRNGLTLAGGTSTATPTYVTIPAGLLTLVGDMTISVWVNVTTERTWQRVLDFGNSTTTGYMFLTPRGATNVLRFAITATDRFAEQFVDGVALPVGTWKHVALVLGSAGASLYVDGVKAGTNAALTLRPADLGAITNHWLGRSLYSADPYFSGRLDELRIYARALSDAEIAQLFTLR